jgi:hypothetical protein
MRSACRSWVKSRHRVRSGSCPLYSQKRTSAALAWPADSASHRIALRPIRLKTESRKKMHTAGGPLIESGCREIFFFSPDISTIKPENYSLSQKIRRKISSPVFSICYCLRSTATGFLDFRFCKHALFRHPTCPTFRVGPMSALPAKADIVQRSCNVRFVP